MFINLVSGVHFNSKKLTFFISLLVFIFFLGLYFCYSGFLQRSNNRSIEQTAYFPLPNQNVMVYTRCGNELEQISYCNLYTSELYKPWTENKIYTFDFQEINQDNLSLNHRIKLYGVIDEYVVYGQNAGSDYQSDNILGLVNLTTGETIAISEHLAEFYNSQHDYHKVYADDINKRVYYLSREDNGLSLTLTSYNIRTKVYESISKYNIPDIEFVLAADEGLVYIGSSGALQPYFAKWDKNYDLNTGQFVLLDEPILDPVFVLNPSFKKVYFNENIDKQSHFQVSLMFMDLSSNEKRVIHSFSSGKEEMYNTPTTSLRNIKASSDGSFITAVVGGKLQQWYSASKAEPDVERGLFADQSLTKFGVSPDIYSLPIDFNYLWIDYIQKHFFLDEYNKTTAILYEYNNNWYLNYGFFDVDETTFVNGNFKPFGTPILLGASQIILIP